MIKYPKIPKYSSLVTTLNRYYRLENKPLPTLKATGTVKLHGTNASILLDGEENLKVFSRNHQISVDNDNAGFAKFVQDNEPELREELLDLRAFYGDEEGNIRVYGEFVGPGIQRGVAISEIENKSFVIFEALGKDGWFYPESFDTSNLPEVYMIRDFPTWEIEIDFLNPAKSQEKLEAITLEVEKECPVSKEILGITGVGEGVVWTLKDGGESYRFKVVGNSHSDSVRKDKKMIVLSPETERSYSDFLETHVNKARITKMMQKAVPDRNYLPRHIGDVIRMTALDILEEELDEINSRGLEIKTLKKKIGPRAKDLYLALANIQV